MKVEITKEERNPFLQRTELRGNILFEGATPSNNDLIQRLPKEDISLVVVKQIITKFGSNKAVFKVFRYDSAEARNKAERITKHLKKQAEDAAKKAAEEKKASEQGE